MSDLIKKWKAASATDHYTEANTFHFNPQSAHPKSAIPNRLGVSVETLKASVTAVTDAISEYNTMLAQVDEKSNEIDEMVKRMTDLATRALKGAEFKFGGNSNEFEMIGGTRKSDRKRPTRKNGGGTEAVK